MTDAAGIEASIRTDDVTEVQRLLNVHGPELANRDLPGGAPPLFLAVACGSLRVAEALLAAGAVVDPAGDYPAIHSAAEGKPEALALLLSYGADPNRVQYDGKTPLHCAAEWPDNRRCIELLVEAGAAVEPGKDSMAGLTPLGWAVGGDNPENVACLLERGADLFATDAEGLTLFEIAETEGYREVLALLERARQTR